MPPKPETARTANAATRKLARAGPVRAALMIGVSKTGNLPTLQAAVDGAVRMGAWAVREQGFEKRRVKVVTDQKKPVQARQLIDAVLALLKDSDVEQLIIYFAGHGVNNGGSEVWLLSGAPLITSEAVNLDGSAYLARQAGVPHVVFISDACRTSADGIQAQQVDGVEIFPNKPNPSPEQAVDIFFATRLGAPSHEIRDPNDAAGRFKAVYTEELIAALEGRHIEVLQEQQDGENVLSFVRPRPLGDYLEQALAARLSGVQGPNGPIVQTPYARLTSREQDAWLARFVERGVARGQNDDPLLETNAGVAGPPSVRFVARAALQSAIREHEADADAGLKAAVADQVSGAALIADSVEASVKVTGPTHFETRCGFKIRGARAIAAVMPDPAAARVFTDTGEGVVVEHLGEPAASVLIEFESGQGVVLPAIRDFIGALTFADGELVAVSYEPSDNSPRWPDYAANAEQFRKLRALAASSVRLGVFRLDGDDAPHLAKMFMKAKGADPVMALYAAYSYYRMHLSAPLQDMNAYTQADLKMSLFDIAMLAGVLGGRVSNSVPGVYPAFPLMAQGWALLSPKKIALPHDLAALRSHLVPSLWSVFDRGGVALLRSAIQSGSLR
jgi:hypothetical protein